MMRIMAARLIIAAALVWAASAAAQEAALRCWRCGDVFTAGAGAATPQCPSCRAMCKRTGLHNRCRLYCFDGGEACSFAVLCPDGGVVLFVGPFDGGGGDLAAMLDALGVRVIDSLIASEKSEDCLRTLVALMKKLEVRRIFDPGFKNRGPLYSGFVALLREKAVSYRTVRAMESFTSGDVKFYVGRPGSLDGGRDKGDALTLCVVHGGNSFLLSRGLRGKGAPSIRERLEETEGRSGCRVRARGACLEASTPPLLAGRPLLIESDGTALGLQYLRQVIVEPGGRAGNVVARAGSTEQPAAERKNRIVNINTASAPELEVLSGIGTKRAATIIKFRESHGPFRSIEEIKKVPGIGEKLFQRNSALLRVK